MVGRLSPIIEKTHPRAISQKLGIGGIYVED